jgi:Co/Zn/Cd efflux system component
MTLHGRLAPRAVFATRVWINALWAAAVIFVSLAVGIAGYMYFGSMGFAQGFANAAMILSGMGPLDKLSTSGGYYFEGLYALVCGLVFFAVAGLVLAPALHRLLHRFHLEDTAQVADSNSKD